MFRLDVKLEKPSERPLNFVVLSTRATFVFLLDQTTRETSLTDSPPIQGDLAENLVTEVRLGKN